MRPIRLEEGVFEAVRSEITGTALGRYQHRLHAVMLVAGGMSCRRVGRLLGASPRVVEYWLTRYNAGGIKGLEDSQDFGRPPRLSATQWAQVREMIASQPPPGALGAQPWSGSALARYVDQKWGVPLGVRQAQRLLARATVIPKT